MHKQYIKGGDFVEDSVCKNCFYWKSGPEGVRQFGWCGHYGVIKRDDRASCLNFLAKEPGSEVVKL